MKKTVKLLSLLPVLLICSQALANVTPHWLKGDIDGDRRPETIFTSNLSDIVFNDQGEIVGWYAKTSLGQSYITEKAGAAPDVSKLAKMPNLVSGSRGLVIPLAGKPSKTLDPKVGTNEAKQFTAEFSYQHAGKTVLKKVYINPTKFTLQVELEVTGGKAEPYKIEIGGLLGANDTQMKAVPQNSQAVVQAGEVPNIQYAAMQKSNWNTSGIIVMQPQAGTKASAFLAPGQPAKMTLTTEGKAKFNVFGGRSELIRLHLEGYDKLPGLFKANIWGQASLGLVWLLQFLHGFIGSWGLTIIALTLLIRLVLWPLMQAQMVSMSEMQAIQPQVKAITEKYPDDAEKRNAETLKLYQEHKVNPAAGCLPMVIQIPILFILWRVFTYFEFGSGFLWLPDLSLPDPLYIMPALYLLVNILQTWISTRKTPETFRQQLIMQFMFVFLALQFPSGVVVYWVLSTFIGVVQQYFINQVIERKIALVNVSKA